VSFVAGGSPDLLELTSSEVAMVELLAKEEMIPRLRFSAVNSES
jgi:hypothetical protein